MTTNISASVIDELRNRLAAGESSQQLMQEVAGRFNLNEEDAWFLVGLAAGKFGDLRLEDPPIALRNLERFWTTPE